MKKTIGYEVQCWTDAQGWRAAWYGKDKRKAIKAADKLGKQNRSNGLPMSRVVRCVFTEEVVA